MTYIPYVPDEVTTFAALLGFGFLFMRQIARQAFGAEQKKSVMRELIQSLGIKNFKPSDLNAGKLDDTGFLRFMALIKVAQGVGVGPSAEAAKLQQAIQQLSALGSLAPAMSGAMPQAVQPRPAQPAVPASQPTQIQSSSETEP